MSNISSNNNDLHIKLSVLVIVATYAVTILVWGIRQEGRISRIEERLMESHTEIEKRIDQIDDRGSRQIPLLIQRVDSLNATIEVLKQQDKEMLSQLMKTTLPDRSKRVYEDKW